MLVTGSGNTIHVHNASQPVAESLQETPANESAAGDPTPLPRATGCPFVVGRPLRSNEPIFGREEAFRFLSDRLVQFSSVNIVGERRIGKTSVVNHLLGNQSKYITQEPQSPPLVLARVDLQGGVSNSNRFYGTALRELLKRLPLDRNFAADALESLRARLDREPVASYDEFQFELCRLRESNGINVWPVIVVDEFEHLLEPSVADGFPYPDFFNGLRALIGAELLAMIVVSYQPLAKYFTDPERPKHFTSDFHTYFQTFNLKLLDDASADSLLLQPSNHPLTLQQVAEAKRWADRHPCHLQAAGRAWYEGIPNSQSPKQVLSRFNQLKHENCTASVNSAVTSPQWAHWLRRGLKVLFWRLPLAIGRPIQSIGSKIDDLVAWFLGFSLLMLAILLLLHELTIAEFGSWVKKVLGL